MGIMDTIGHKSRAGAVDGYPFDFDASLRFVRPATGVDYFGTPRNENNFAQLGCFGGGLPQMDIFVWAQGIGKPAFGPGTATLPTNLQNQAIVRGLTKQLPQY